MCKGSELLLKYIQENQAAPLSETDNVASHCWLCQLLTLIGYDLEEVCVGVCVYISHEPLAKSQSRVSDPVR